MWAVSTFWRLSRMLLWTFVYKCLFEHLFSILWVYIPRSGITLVILYLTSWRPSKLPQWLHRFAFVPAIYKGSNFSISLLTFLIFFFFFLNYSHPMGRSGVSVWFWFESYDDGDVECLSLCSSVICQGALALYQHSATADKSVQKGVELGEWL